MLVGENNNADSDQRSLHGLSISFNFAFRRKSFERFESLKRNQKTKYRRKNAISTLLKGAVAINLFDQHIKRRSIQFRGKHNARSQSIVSKFCKNSYEENRTLLRRNISRNVTKNVALLWWVQRKTTSVSTKLIKITIASLHCIYIPFI